MTLAAMKAALRTQYRAARKALAPSERATQTAAVVEALEDLLEHLRAPALASYLATGSELDLGALHAWWWRRQAVLHLPRVRPDLQLSWHAVQASTPLLRGAHGIREPDPVHAPAVPLPAGCVVLVPGVAFDAEGHRLGQGGGSYDRALAAGIGVPVGVGFPAQDAPALPREAHDQRVQYLVLGRHWRAVR